MVASFTALTSLQAQAQTYFDLSASNYSEDFAAIANTATWPAPISTNSWSAVAVNATGTIPDGSKTTVSSATFTTGTSGGLQRGPGNIQLLSTGATDNTTSVAVDLNMNFTGRTTGNLSFNAAAIANGTGDRKGTLRVYYSTNGTTWTEITGANLPFVATNNVAGSAAVNVPIPSGIDGQSQVRLRFYEHNGNGGTTGSRPKISIDDVVVTSISSTVDTTAPVLSSTNPLTGATGVLPTANLALTYDESITAGSGTIAIKKLSDNSIVESITVPSSQVSVLGATATINPATVLAYTTQYYIEITAGTFKDPSNNPAAAITGSGTMNFTTRAAASLVINQYYEGVSTNRFIELRNLTGSPITMDGYRLAAWSATDSPSNQAWKSGTNTSPRVTALDGLTIPANGYYLISDPAATAPAYAVANHDLATPSFPTLSTLSFSGTASVVLYSSASNDQNSIVDAVSITGNEGTDTSFYRLDNLPGFDFTTGSSITNYSSTWGTKTVAQVDSANVTDDWYLRASQLPKFLTLDITPSTFSEGAGPGAATATVTRSGSTVGDLVVTITVSDTSEASAAPTVTILDGSDNATFPINAVNDLYLDGDVPVTVTVSATNHTPANKLITVTDELSDIPYPVVINELDSDQAGSDTAEFIELFNDSPNLVSLDGVVLIFYNGATNTSYRTIDLTGKTIAAHGFYVVGNPGVANVGTTFPIDTLQNGEDAVALYLGLASYYPNGTAVATTAGKLVDAVVYGTNDPPATALLAALTPGKSQVDEGASPASETVAIARRPDGGAAFASNLYVAQAPSPGLTNVLPPPNNYANWIDGFFPGATDPLIIGFGADPDNDGVLNGVEALTGANPNSPGVLAITELTKTANGFSFLYPKSKSPPVGVTAAYEWTTNLTNWQASGGTFGGVTVTLVEQLWDDSALNVDIYKVTATVTAGTIDKIFLRVAARK